MLDLLKSILVLVQELLVNVYHDPHVDPTTLPMNLPPQPMPPVPPVETIKQMVLRVCKEEKLNLTLTNSVYATIHCESNFNTQAINLNKNAQGKVVSTDYGICQINDYWHIGPGKDFPSFDYVLKNPEACVRWMCKMAKAGELNLWVCFQKGLYKSYL